VYFLFGTDDASGGNLVYIGQADIRKNGNGLLGRLYEHKGNPEKDYWTEAVVFTTKDKDNWLGATEISWLESHFVSLAKKAKRYIVKNSNEPSPGKPTEERISDLEEFAKYTAIAMGVLNHRVFEPVAEPDLAAENSLAEPLMLEIILGGNDSESRIDVKGYETNEGFVLLKGGKIKIGMADSCRDRIKNLRVEFASKYDNTGVLLDNILLKSPNEAANFATGYPINALTTWKTADGKTLKELQSEASPL
jgi:hypothetical protein